MILCQFFQIRMRGGIIIFGINEKQDYKEVGVYDPQDIQKKINEQYKWSRLSGRYYLLLDEKLLFQLKSGVDLTDRPVFIKEKDV